MFKKLTLLSGLGRAYIKEMGNQNRQPLTPNPSPYPPPTPPPPPRRAPPPLTLTLTLTTNPNRKRAAAGTATPPPASTSTTTTDGQPRQRLGRQESASSGMLGKIAGTPQRARTLGE